MANGNDFEEFRESFVNLAEGYLNERTDIARQVISGLSSTEFHLTGGRCIEATGIHLGETGSFGYFLARYASGRIASQLKSAIFATEFYKYLECPAEIKADGDVVEKLEAKDQVFFTKLMTVLFRSLLRVQIKLERKDVREVTDSSRVQLVISVARLGIPEQSCEGQRTLDELLEDLSSSPEVRTAFQLSFPKAGTYYVFIGDTYHFSNN